jgi:UDP-N-acetyl-D-glucosamine dehydrogenase
MRTFMTDTRYRDRLLGRLAAREARVGVVGLGYVGLPLAMVFADAGFSVTGVDVNAARVEALNAGRSHVEDVASSVVSMHQSAGRFQATTEFTALAECDAISICVPTPLRKTRDPDMSFILRASEEVAKRLRPGHLVILESTSYPGTTREVLLPLIEARGLTVGEDVFLAFSPERVDPGRTDWTTKNTPKVVGGVTAPCLDVATALYAAAMDTVVPVSSPEAAELTKIFENTFRAVNIGLANELLLICDTLGLDVWEVSEAAATKPFGFMKFTPGPGLGGHCLPVDPHYLSWKLRGLSYTARFIELASEVNTAMPKFWVRKVQDALNEEGKALKGSRLLVLGVAYKPDVADLRESPALDILALLADMGAEVCYHDPHVPMVQHDGLDLASEPDLDAALASADCAVLVTNHTMYEADALAAGTALFVNTRGPGVVASGPEERAERVAADVR